MTRTLCSRLRASNLSRTVALPLSRSPALSPSRSLALLPVSHRLCLQNITQGVIAVAAYSLEPRQRLSLLRKLVEQKGGALPPVPRQIIVLSFGGAVAGGMAVARDRSAV